MAGLRSRSLTELINWTLRVGGSNLLVRSLQNIQWPHWKKRGSNRTGGVSLKESTVAGM
jgi:hypothetical protein